MTTTIFSWGYYGWGNYTEKLIATVDAIEKSRGFQPPIFVDIRINRSVRAAGFNGAHFEKLLGSHGKERYVRMDELGNTRIGSVDGPKIQIKEPAAAKELLELAQLNAKKKRRLIYFCGCPWPRWGGKIECHRASVTGLLLKAAKKQESSVRIVEWPGGKPGHFHFDLGSDLFVAVRKGRVTIPLEDDKPDVEQLGLPWCSVATLHCDGGYFHRIVGPATPHKNQWCLPVLGSELDPNMPLAEYKEKAGILRRKVGLELAEA